MVFHDLVLHLYLSFLVLQIRNVYLAKLFLMTVRSVQSLVQSLYMLLYVSTWIWGCSSVRTLKRCVHYHVHAFVVTHGSQNTLAGIHLSDCAKAVPCRQQQVTNTYCCCIWDWPDPEVLLQTCTVSTTLENLTTEMRNVPRDLHCQHHTIQVYIFARIRTLW